MLARPRAALAAAVAVVGPLAGPALADHGGPLRDAPMSPLTIGLLVGGLVLAVGLVVVALVSALGGKNDDARDDA